jgi:pimeloyl-ACP methyl ester carboxylesterase
MRRLIVVVPGIRGHREGWQPLVDRLKIEPALANTEYQVWNLKKKWYSLGNPERLAVELAAWINLQWVARGPFDDLILVGHSMGGLLIRRAYLLACGVDRVTKQQSEWAARVSRIILFAAPNRGVNPDASFYLRATNWLGRMFPPLRWTLSWQLFRGSEFVTNLRIEWIRYFAAIGDKAPVVVQLLGTLDGLVARDDSIDIEQFPTAYYISIPDANHSTLFRLDVAPDPEGRYALLRDGFVHERPKHAENIQIAGAEQVVFVMHGIRADNRTWVEQTIELINKGWPGVEAIGPRHERLSALKFAIPMTRHRNVRWFQDKYSEALARNPHARFSFIGHSNGTYLLGESLRTIPGMQFEHAALVGPVLPASFDWDGPAKRGQIGALRVDGSCYDWPVGWLCSALRGLGMRDIGTGGYEGFTTLANNTKHEFFWYSGGHSAPLAAANLPALAAFAVAGSLVSPQCGKEVAWFSFVSRILKLSFVGMIVVLAGIVYLLVVNPLAGLAVLAAVVLAVVILDAI